MERLLRRQAIDLGLPTCIVVQGTRYIDLAESEALVVAARGS